MRDCYFKISKREYFLNIAAIVLVLFLCARLFYGTLRAGFFLLPLGVLILKQRKQKMCKKKMEILEAQFKDMLISVSDAMTTGYSIENAIRESYRDMLSAYGYDSDICRELRLMISRIKLNVNVETVLSDFAERTGMKDAKMFSRIFSVAKKTGGNMTEVIHSVSDNIALKESVKAEIQVEIHSKKLEQRIMMVIPLFLIAYVSVASSGFMDVMYQTWMGRIVMTICLICYIGALVWSEKISDIRV